MNKITTVCCLLLCLSLPATSAAESAYRLSMLPRYYPKKIEAMIQPLSAYLSETTKARITPVLTKDFSEYASQLNAGKIEIGYENPLVYTQVSGTHEALVMAVKGEGGDRFRGIVITRPDSDIHTISDLKHKRIMVVGKTSAGGFLSQKLSLAKNGIEVEEDCQLEEASGNKQENVIISVSIGDVDAGFIRESALHVADAFIQPGSVVQLAPCAWLPNWAVSVNKTMPEQMKNRIKAALLSLDKDSKELKALRVTGFRATADHEYDIIRNHL